MVGTARRADPFPAKRWSELERRLPAGGVRGCLEHAGKMPALQWVARRVWAAAAELIEFLVILNLL